MLQSSADELQRISNAAHDKQIFLVVDESTLSGIQSLNILVGERERERERENLFDLLCAPTQ